MKYYFLWLVKLVAFIVLAVLACFFGFLAVQAIRTNHYPACLTFCIGLSGAAQLSAHLTRWRVKP